MPEPAPTPAATVLDPGTGACPTILVIDADDRTRESIVGILGIRHRFTVVGSAGHPGEAIALVRSHRPDVVIIDPRLPDAVDGIALIRRIHAICPDARILAVGWTPGLEHDALEAGADAYVRKTFRPDDLSDAIDRCLCVRPASPGTGPKPQE